MNPAHADILDQHDSLRKPFTGALMLHLGVIAGLGVTAWLNGPREAFGDPNAGGTAVGIEVTKSIPLAHSGPQNPVAHDTPSQVPQEPVKQERAKKEPPPPKNAVELKSKTAKQLRAKVEPQVRHFKSFEDLDPNKIKSPQAPAVSSPMFSEVAGAGRIGTGANTTLGTRFGEYSQRVQQLVQQKWRTGDVDASIRTGPLVIANFEIHRDGSIGPVRIVQRSGIATLDFSVQRAILDASPFPPLPQGFERNSAVVEFVFELKR